jgi:hypothetical protein
MYLGAASSSLSHARFPVLQDHPSVRKPPAMHEAFQAPCAATSQRSENDHIYAHALEQMSKVCQSAHQLTSGSYELVHNRGRASHTSGGSPDRCLQVSRDATPVSLANMHEAWTSAQDCANPRGGRTFSASVRGLSRRFLTTCTKKRACVNVGADDTVSIS